MRRLASRSRYLMGGTGVAILIGYGGLVVLGLAEPHQWSSGICAGGVTHGSTQLEQPPFPVLPNLDVFDMNPHNSGNHFLLLGCDPGRRDPLALTASVS